MILVISSVGDGGVLDAVVPGGDGNGDIAAIGELIPEVILLLI